MKLYREYMVLDSHERWTRTMLDKKNEAKTIKVALRFQEARQLESCKRRRKQLEKSSINKAA